jgi:hypothetical protein
MSDNNIQETIKMADRYYQCSKCKALLTFDDVDPSYDTPQKITTAIKHCNRRCRELTQKQYDHEIAQRAYIGGGDPPSGTELMQELL